MKYQHLTIGSQCPPFIEGKLRYYQTAYCPFAHRCRLALIAKNIPFEAVDINTDRKPEWYVDPLTTIPCLYIDKDTVLIGSQPIAEYLEKTYPNVKLNPSEHKDLIDEFQNVSGNFYKCIKNSDQQDIDNLWKSLDLYESRLVDDYFGGKSPLWVDYVIWPLLDRLQPLMKLKNIKELDRSRFQKLSSYITRMQQREEVKATGLPENVILKYLEIFSKGPAPYDGIDV